LASVNGSLQKAKLKPLTTEESPVAH